MQGQQAKGVPDDDASLHHVQADGEPTQADGKHRSEAISQAEQALNVGVSAQLEADPFGPDLRWHRNHPSEQVISNVTSLVRTRGQLMHECQRGSTHLEVARDLLALVCDISRSHVGQLWCLLLERDRVHRRDLVSRERSDSVSVLRSSGSQAGQSSGTAGRSPFS
ncbi:hypothetical protein F511_39543 [Dorcoceras hygrometricum]|uniref:Uncharacterized protein n=1 Tax=Dorcoceras hygrometricum TaxID=472368 RepID=A0A2Z7BY22_9LAMI|nr:hypothetical protein F511_39543 [Dorcoceras hygrometricum]